MRQSNTDVLACPFQDTIEYTKDWDNSRNGNNKDKVAYLGAKVDVSKETPAAGHQNTGKESV